MKWAYKDPCRWKSFFALVPHLCWPCRRWFWLERGHKKWDSGIYSGWTKHNCTACGPKETE
jgi:hypothetical protein